MERICGIYKITNKVNGKVYIGQSVHIKQRWKNHKKDAFWTKGVDYNYPLYQAIRKYGYDNFLFEVVEECSKEELNDKEKLYIQQYQSFKKKYGYNQTLGGDSQEHAKKLTKEDVDKIIIRLKTSYDSANIICKEFGVGATLIRDINRGDIYYRENETYPIRPKLYTLQGFYDKKKQDAQANPSFKPYRPPRLICPICGHEKSSKAAMCNSCYKTTITTDKPEALELARLITKKGFEAVGRQFNVTGKTIAHWCKMYSMPTHKEEIKNWYYTQANISPPEKPIRRKKSDIMKRVNQLDIHTHEIIATFDTPSEAARAISDKADDSHISQVCRGKRKSAYGYFWQYADE